MRRLGIFGGTFDPIHHAHLAIGEEARVRLKLDQVLFVPAAHQPLKAGHAASAQDRLAMVRLATATNPAFAFSDIEIRREGKSYTIDTLQMLHQQFPTSELWLIVGADSIHTLPRWHRIAELIELVQFAIFERPQSSNDFSDVLRTLPNLANRMTRFFGSRIDLSASELRERVAHNLPIRYLVPDAVADYIAEKKLYQNKE